MTKKITQEENKLTRQRTYQNVERLMQSKGVLPSHVASELGMRTSLFSEWKSGKSQPKYDKLALIARYFNTTVDALIAE